MRVKLHPEVIRFFLEQGTILNAGCEEKYLYYPFWLKTLPDGVVEVVQWDNIPEELKELIKDQRNGTAKTITTK